MKKILFILFCLLIQTTIVYSARTCQDIQEPNVACEIITPKVSCSTYDLYNTSHELIINDGTMTQISTTGTYNFTFNQPTPGTYLFNVCDVTPGVIEVANYSMKNIYENPSTAFLIDVANKVWTFIIGYINPAGSTLNANDTLRTIAENTEPGAW